MDAGRKSLEKRLGDFLGFDDDDESMVDVLDQLLAIESEDDLMDYISQLLGSRSNEIKEFVQDIGRYQKGEPLEGIEEVVVEVKPSKPAPSVAATAPPVSKQTNKDGDVRQPKTKPAPSAASPKVPPKAPPVPSNQKKLPPPTAKVQQHVATPSEKAEGAHPSSTKQCVPVPTEQQQPAPPQKKKYGLPPKGKASFVCGCFGTLHKPLTNCLYCGRISCAEEGYDFCPYCGFLVEEVKPPEGEPTSSSKAKAWQHKERLLRYDRESAKRTVVLDDQADYYSNQNSSWLTEEEQANAELKDDEQRRNIHQRKKQVLNIAF